MSESQQGPEICHVISAKHYSVSLFPGPLNWESTNTKITFRVPLFLSRLPHYLRAWNRLLFCQPANTAVSPCSTPLETFRTAQAAKRNKEKLLYSHATILPAPGKFTPNYCLPKIYIKPEFQPPTSFAKTLGLMIASEGGGWNSGNWSIACVASSKAAKDFKSTFPILLTA